MLCSEIKLVLIDRERGEQRVIFSDVWDPLRMDPQELLWAVSVLRATLCRCVRRELERRGVDIAKLRREALDVLRKGSRTGKLAVDPAMHGAPHMLVNTKAPKDIGLWWCDGGATGKKFTDELRYEPYVAYFNRRAVALNPWGLDNIGDLDTIIDSVGAHKAGTIGKGPFSFSRSQSGKEAVIGVSFVASSTTTIRSVILLTASDSSRTVTGTASSEVPAPPGTCDPDSYASIYVPVWGFDVSWDITADLTYAVDIRLYAP